MQKEFDRGKFIFYDKIRMNIARPENKNHDLFLGIDGGSFPFKARPTNRVSLRRRGCDGMERVFTTRNDRKSNSSNFRTFTSPGQ